MNITLESPCSTATLARSRRRPSGRSRARRTSAPPAAIEQDRRGEIEHGDLEEDDPEQQHVGAVPGEHEIEPVGRQADAPPASASARPEGPSGRRCARNTTAATAFALISDCAATSTLRPVYWQVRNSAVLPTAPMTVSAVMTYLPSARR